jgi:hypothetical protein
MEIDASGSTPAFSGRSRSINTSLKKFDLPSLIECLRDTRGTALKPGKRKLFF